MFNGYLVLLHVVVILFIIWGHSGYRTTDGLSSRDRFLFILGALAWELTILVLVYYVVKDAVRGRYHRRVAAKPSGDLSAWQCIVVYAGMILLESASVLSWYHFTHS